MTKKNNIIILFYDGFEIKAIDSFWGSTFSILRFYFRKIYKKVLRKQPYTGYYTAFSNLVKSLRKIGCDVYINDFKIARRYPDHPIGLCGYGSVFRKVCLPNPALAFHAAFGAPGEVEHVTRRNNIKIFAIGSDWVCALYRAELGDRIRSLYVGIDTDAWPDVSGHHKDIDYLIYDKIRWRREDLVPRLLNRVQDGLKARGKTTKTLRYGMHHVSQFRTALRRSKGMIFLCEHESQGLAYQEALSSGVPVLAWDEGELIDPSQKPYLPTGMRVTSVPLFDERCGMRFQMANFESILEQFEEKKNEFSPRDFIEDTISLEVAAQEFLLLYNEVRNF